MSLRPESVEPVPEETARVARAAFPRGNIYLRMRDALGALFTDDMFAPLFPTRGQPALSPWRLALITIRQYAEGLSDRQAADAVRGRIDWKYALSLELGDSGFDHSVLSEFRARLLAGHAEELLFETLLAHLRARKLVAAGGQQRTDSTHILAAVRALNRLELVGETSVLLSMRSPSSRPCGSVPTVSLTGSSATVRRSPNFACPAVRQSVRPSP